MRLPPQLSGFDHWINSDLQPPNRFVATAMDFAMVPAAQRHRELITRLSPKCWALREADMVGVRWSPPTDQARLFGNETDVIAIADPPRLREARTLLSIFSERSRLTGFTEPGLRRCGLVARLANRGVDRSDVDGPQSAISKTRQERGNQCIGMAVANLPGAFTASFPPT